MTIKVRNNNVEAALRVFKRLYAERVFEYKERRYYEKPSETRAKAIGSKDPSARRLRA